MDNFELIHLLRRAARHSREGMEEGRFGMMPPPPPFGELPPEGEQRGPHPCGPGPRGPHPFGPEPHGMGPDGPCGRGPHGMGPHRERERVLCLLDETEGVSQQKLALILGIRPQSLSELLGKLEKDGLLLREKNPDDRRETLVSLTAEGKARAASFEEERRRAGDAFLAPLTEEERETLGALLTKLLEGQEEE